MTGPTGHSRFGASSAHRWTECPGSVEAQTGLPDTSSPEAQEGTALHAVAADCLEHERDANHWTDREFEYEDHGEHKTIWIDEDQAECVQVFLDTVRGDLAECPESTLLVEQRFHLDHLHPEFFGTCDAVRVDGNGYPLSVYDLKTGKGYIVEVRDKGPASKINKQLGYYGLGAIGKLPLINSVVLVIVQPRAYHPDGPVRRTWATPEELQELTRELVHAAHWAESTWNTEGGPLHPPRKAGEWCRFCRAAPTCDALANHVFDRANVVFDDATALPVIASENRADVLAKNANDIAFALEAANVIEEWIAQVRKHAHSLVERGYEVPGWKLVQKRAMRKWKDTAAAERELYFTYGLAETSIRSYSILSPAQAEKLVPKDERKEMAKLWTAESSGVTLVRESNSRPAVLPSSTAAFIEDQSAKE